MCARSVMPKRKTIEDAFRIRSTGNLDGVTRHLAPGRLLAGVHGASRTLLPFRYGYRGGEVYNARLETAPEKSMWRGAWEGKRRMILPLSCFAESGTWFEIPGEVLAVAGLWSTFWSPDGLREVAVLTCPAIDPVAQVHHRAPVLLAEYLWDDWLAGLPIENSQLQDDSVSTARLLRPLAA
jgi:putative SOS response-associated peptidase YedK